MSPTTVTLDDRTAQDFDPFTFVGGVEFLDLDHLPAGDPTPDDPHPVPRPQRLDSDTAVPVSAALFSAIVAVTNEHGGSIRRLVEAALVTYLDRRTGPRRRRGGRRHGGRAARLSSVSIQSTTEAMRPLTSHGAKLFIAQNGRCATCDGRLDPSPLSRFRIIHSPAGYLLLCRDCGQEGGAK